MKTTFARVVVSAAVVALVGCDSTPALDAGSGGGAGGGSAQGGGAGGGGGGGGSPQAAATIECAYAYSHPLEDGGTLADGGNPVASIVFSYFGHSIPVDDAFASAVAPVINGVPGALRVAGCESVALTTGTYDPLTAGVRLDLPNGAPASWQVSLIEITDAGAYGNGRCPAHLSDGGYVPFAYDVLDTKTVTIDLDPLCDAGI